MRYFPPAITIIYGKKDQYIQLLEYRVQTYLPLTSSTIKKYMNTISSFISDIFRPNMWQSQISQILPTYGKKILPTNRIFHSYGKGFCPLMGNGYYPPMGKGYYPSMGKGCCPTIRKG